MYLVFFQAVAVEDHSTTIVEVVVAATVVRATTSLKMAFYFTYVTTIRDSFSLIHAMYVRLSFGSLQAEAVAVVVAVAVVEVVAAQVSGVSTCLSATTAQRCKMLTIDFHLLDPGGGGSRGYGGGGGGPNLKDITCVLTNILPAKLGKPPFQFI